MPGEALLDYRKPLNDICSIPDKIISVYSLEQHVWADSNSPEARQIREPEVRTIDEFQIDPVRPFLNDIFRNMAAPYRPERRDQSIGQGYWVQAEFGSGKSHLLCFLSALALGTKEGWERVRDKEQKAGRGRRESLYRFWEEGLQAKSSQPNKGVFVIVKTLVGTGGGAVGRSEDRGRDLVEYILDAAREQLQLELGQNLSVYPAELLVDRFLERDLDLYREPLRRFLKDPAFFDEDEVEDLDTFVRDMQANKSPDYKKSVGNKLWRFYTEYLRVTPQVAAETEDILKHLVELILAQGYSGVLLVLDEVSLFMKNRADDQRIEDEKTLVVLSNRLAKVHNLPIWTVCSAQQAIESKLGYRNIIADDRLKLVKLLEADKDYYNIVLARVREVTDPAAVRNYYLHYRRGFTWPNVVGEEDFAHFFPFHKPALEVLRAVSYNLTTTRSAISVMHQVLKHQRARHSNELIRLWELFDDTVRYEEDPSGVYAGIAAIKSQRETEYQAYDACRRQIEGMTKGALKVNRDKAVKTVQTLMLYHLGRTRQQGLTAEEIANSVLIERAADATPDENIQHYETIAENLKRELRQIATSTDEDGRPRYRFDPVYTGADPRREFSKARDEAETNEAARLEAWEHLLALDEWPLKMRQLNRDLSAGRRSLFHAIAPQPRAPLREPLVIDVLWQGRQIHGTVAMRDLRKLAADHISLPVLDSAESDNDFAVYVSPQPVDPALVQRLLSLRKDRRILVWTPASLTQEERDLLLDFAAYRRLVQTWQGKESEEALTILNWVGEQLAVNMGRIVGIVGTSYQRGRVASLDHPQLDFHVAGDLTGILTPLVERVLNAAYESRDLRFEPPLIFRAEEAVKVINGIVKTGSIPRGAKPNQVVSAVQNFGYGLRIVKKGDERTLDTSDNPYVAALWEFIEGKLVDDGQTMPVATLYKNFMGVGGPKDYGLSRRLVQLYLLCLVQQGKVRVGVNARAGLSHPWLDYATIGDVDFSARILDNLTEVQKLAQPENWDALRPFAERLLERAIPATHDDAVIAATRKELRERFIAGKEQARRLKERAESLFEVLGSPNPYAQELEQVVRLFRHDISLGDDIASALYAFKDALGYAAFDTGRAEPADVDDFGVRLGAYRALERFVDFGDRLRAAVAYVAHDLPDTPDLRAARAAQQEVRAKLADLRPYIDSEVMLQTELIGAVPPQTGERGTLGVLIHEYTLVYTALHDHIVGLADDTRQTVENLLRGDDLRALKRLEEIRALQPAVSPSLEAVLRNLASRVFTCKDPSRAAVERRLKDGPVDGCGLTFATADEVVGAVQAVAEEAQRRVDEAVRQKLSVFVSPAVRSRLEQGREVAIIADLLSCHTVDQVRAVLLPAVLRDPSVVATISHTLKRIVVKQVRLADFRPSLQTIERGQIPEVVAEFQTYLEQQMASVDGGGDTLPVLQVE